MFSRSQLKLRAVRILLNGREVKPSKKVKTGDLLEVFYGEPPEPRALPEDIPLDMVYEDADVCVINKPRGMVVHPACGNYTGTLVNALLFHLKGLGSAFPENTLRPGIVHRLDKDTSGIIITAKNQRALEYLCAQFKERKAEKRYLALVKGGLPAQRGRVETLIYRDPRHRKRFMCAPLPGGAPLQDRAASGKPAGLRSGPGAPAGSRLGAGAHSGPGKPAGARKAPAKARRALTFYRVVKSWGDIHLVSLKPYTGRTHQLRAQLRYLGAPVIGDTVYGTKTSLAGFGRLLLHAYKLRITLPGAKQAREFKAPLPADFRRYIRELNTTTVL
jgi:23S rRNA pseudouridine1911/1915/1917 synthase